MDVLYPSIPNRWKVANESDSGPDLYGWVPPSRLPEANMTAKCRYLSLWMSS